MTTLYQKHAKWEAKAKFLRQMANVLGAPVAAGTVPLIANSEPERDELRRLADSLPIEKIRGILKNIADF